MFILLAVPAVCQMLAHAHAQAQAQATKSKMKLTPLHISLLIDYITDSKFPYNCGAPAVVEYTNELLREGLINCCVPAAACLVQFRGYAGSPHPYVGTAKGRALLDRLCKTPVDVAEYLRQVHGGDEIARLKRQDAVMTKVYEGMVALGWKPESQDDCTHGGDHRAKAILKFVKTAQEDALNAGLRLDKAQHRIEELEQSRDRVDALTLAGIALRLTWKPGYFVNSETRNKLVFTDTDKAGVLVATRGGSSLPKGLRFTDTGPRWDECGWTRVEAPFWYKTGESSGVAVLSDDVRVEFDGPTAPLPAGVTMGAFLKAIANPI